MRNLFTFFVVAIIGLTSCEKSDMNEGLTSNDVDRAIISGTLNASNKASKSVGTVIIEVRGTQDLIGMTPTGKDLFEALEYTGEPNTDSYNVTGSLVYHIDDAGYLVASFNNEKGNQYDIHTQDYDIVFIK